MTPLDKTRVCVHSCLDEASKAAKHTRLAGYSLTALSIILIPTLLLISLFWPPFSWSDFEWKQTLIRTGLLVIPTLALWSLGRTLFSFSLAYGLRAGHFQDLEIYLLSITEENFSSAECLKAIQDLRRVNTDEILLTLVRSKDLPIEQILEKIGKS